MAISRNSAILDSAILDLDFKMGWKLGLIKSSSWAELRLHTENQLTGCPGYGLILVRDCLLVSYGGKVKSTNLSWLELCWAGLSWSLTISFIFPQYLLSEAVHVKSQCSLML